MITKHPHQVRNNNSNSSSSVPSTATPSAPTRKRTHLKPSQLTVLQNSFSVNPLPDASVRSQLAHDLNVSERTIQIWFQNRRAKARKLEALSNSLTAVVATAGTANSHPHYPHNIHLPQHTNDTTHPLAAMAFQQQQQQQHLSSSQQDSILLPRWMEQATRAHHQPRYQPTFRTMMTPERFEELKQQPTQPRRNNGRPRSNSKPEKVVIIEDEGEQGIQNPPTIEIRAMSEGIQQKQHSSPEPQLQHQQTPQTPQQAQQNIVPLLNIQTLRIGSWSRFACQQANGNNTLWDLKCFVDPINKQMTWQVLAEGHLFRIELHMGSITQIRLVQEGQLEIELDPQNCCFAMFHNQEWVRCGDFSEDKQASREKVHVLLGNHDALQQVLLDLAALVPELTAKMILTPLPLMMDDNDLMSCSPSVTPEPFLNFSPLYPTTTNTTTTTTMGVHPTAAGLQVPQVPRHYQQFDKSLWNAYSAGAVDPTSSLYQMSPYEF